jgi:hypothetical protein
MSERGVNERRSRVAKHTHGKPVTWLIVLEHVGHGEKGLMVLLSKM